MVVGLGVKRMHSSSSEYSVWVIAARACKIVEISDMSSSGSSFQRL